MFICVYILTFCAVQLRMDMTRKHVDTTSIATYKFSYVSLIMKYIIIHIAPNCSNKIKCVCLCDIVLPGEYVLMSCLGLHLWIHWNVEQNPAKCKWFCGMYSTWGIYFSIWKPNSRSDRRYWELVICQQNGLLFSCGPLEVGRGCGVVGVWWSFLMNLTGSSNGAVLDFRFSPNYTSLNVRERYFTWYFKEYLWNFTQIISPIHWKVRFYILNNKPHTINSAYAF